MTISLSSSCILLVTKFPIKRNKDVGDGEFGFFVSNGWTLVDAQLSILEPKEHQANSQWDNACASMSKF